MQNNILKITTYLFALLTLCLHINAQIKTKVFYTEVPLHYKSILAKTTAAHKIDAPPEFYDLMSKKETIEDIKFAFPVKMNIDFMKEAIMEKDDEALKYSLTINAKDA
ncbi:MAG: hypothetical protein ABUT20_57420 [Bacteroidota bacterium]